MVWSDAEIHELAKYFVPVTEESYFLYPEHPEHRRAAQGHPVHEFFKKFGAQVPPSEWNEPGTKQGIYVIGPNSEYLGAQFAAPPKDVVVRMLKQARATWETRRPAQYREMKPVPWPKSVAWFPERAAGAGLFLRVNSRDLPRRPGGLEGRRFHEVGAQGENWNDFRKWAWNQDFADLSPAEARGFAPSGREAPVPEATVRRLVREFVVDNVRGQVSGWADRDIQSAQLIAESVGTEGALRKYRYRGEVRVRNAARAISGTLYGEALWNPGTGKFEQFELVLSGTRQGADRFNNRQGDLGPAPIGFSFYLDRP